MNNITYRKAAHYDYPGILVVFTEVQKMHAQSLPKIFDQETLAMTPSAFHMYLFSSSHRVIVAELDGCIIGYSFAQLIYSPSSARMKGSHIAFIDYIGVKKEYHRFGIGSNLFALTKKWAKKKKAHSLQLNVWNFNQKAIRFYEKHGMEPVSCLMHLPLG